MKSSLADPSDRTVQEMRLLLVGAVEDSNSRNGSIFSQSPWLTQHAAGCQEALPLIGEGVHCVIICERDLPDGSWKDILGLAAERHDPPLVIVSSQQADDYLWAEVLNLGGYDVLAKPFDRNEVHRTIGMAWHQWESRREMASARRAHAKKDQHENRRAR